MARTLQMFDKPTVPRLVRMHVIDAGDPACMADDDVDMICRYACRKCGRETDWLPARSTTEAKRGIPCPNCNAPTASEKS